MTQNQVSTLRKGLIALELVKEEKGITLAEVMKKLEMSKSTAFRIINDIRRNELCL